MVKGVPGNRCVGSKERLGASAKWSINTARPVTSSITSTMLVAPGAAESGTVKGISKAPVRSALLDATMLPAYLTVAVLEGVKP